MTMRSTERKGRSFGLKLVLAGALLTAPGLALADVNTGVAAWQRGDYATAVAEWREPAGQGDADAQFNLGQAYRLGRGVEQNTRQAEVYYAKAAAQGHLKAADNLGLLLFQNGRQQDAMPYVLDAASRGAAEGLRLALNVGAMLLAFLALSSVMGRYHRVRSLRWARTLELSVG